MCGWITGLSSFLGHRLASYHSATLCSTNENQFYTRVSKTYMKILLFKKIHDASKIKYEDCFVLFCFEGALLSLLAISGLFVLYDGSSNTFGVNLFGVGYGGSPQTKNKLSAMCPIHNCCCPQNQTKTAVMRQNPPLLSVTKVNLTNQTNNACEV